MEILLPNEVSAFTGTGSGAIYNNYESAQYSTYTSGTKIITRSSDKTFRLDASRVNAIYGSSNTVQPPALQLIPQIKF